MSHPSSRLHARLAELERKSLALEPRGETRDRWDREVLAYAHKFIDELPASPAFQQSGGRDEVLRGLSIGESGKPMSELLRILEWAVDGPGLNPASGGHLGYIPGGGIYPTALGDYLAAITNRYAGLFYASPGAVRMENELLRWLNQLVGYPEDALGNLASGGSVANLIAITTARDKMGIRSREVERAVIYLTRQVHHCVQKALRIAGLGGAVIRYVDMDERFRMKPENLARLLASDTRQGLTPFLLVASAGTTDTGAIDPLDALADLAKAHGLWFHVDAAYGGMFLMVPGLKAAFSGIERSDSLVIDPHKGLFLSYGLGAVLIKDVRAMYDAHFYKAGYMQDAQRDLPEWSPADLSPELTKHFRGLRMWLPLHLFGLAPFRAALEEKALLCRYFYEEVGNLGFRTGPEPELSVVLFRYEGRDIDSDAFNKALLHHVLEDGRVFMSSTSVNGQFWLRLAILSFRTHRKEIDICLELLKDGIDKLSAG